MDYETITRAMRRLALEAGAVIREIYEANDFEVRAKDDASPVTDADEKADALIAAGLAAAFPEIPAVTEERGDSHSISAPVFFLVDPLDGTREFVRRGGDFTVNIALVEHGASTRGVVYAPVSGRLFYTDATGRSVEEAAPRTLDTAGATHPLRVSAPDPDGLVVVASKSHRDRATDAYIARYRVRACRAAGSSLKFCLVAAGEADFYPRLGRTMEWDTAAGQAVLVGAGGRVVRIDDHETLTYGKPGIENPFFLAYAPGVALVS